MTIRYFTPPESGGIIRYNNNKHIYNKYKQYIGFATLAEYQSRKKKGVFRVSMGNKVFYQIPNNVVWSYNNKEKSIYQLINNDKLILLFMALDFTTNYNGLCNCTVAGLLDICNLPINKENVKLFKDILLELHKMELFTFVNEVDINKYDKNKWLIIKPNWFVVDGNNRRIHYFTLYKDEVDKIMTYNKKSVSRYKLLTYYCYLVSRMYNRRNYTNSEGELVKATLGADKAETCHPSFDEITRDLGINDNTITKYNDILSELDLIRFENAGFKKKIEHGKEIVRRSSNTYVLLRNPNWEEELKYSIDAYIASQEKKGWEFIDDEKTESMIKQKQVLSNTINRLEYLKDTKGITEEQERKLQDCIEKKQAKQQDNNGIIVGRRRKSFAEQDKIMAGFTLADKTDNKVMADDSLSDDGRITCVEDILNNSKYVNIIYTFSQKYHKRVDSVVALMENLEEYFVSDDFNNKSTEERYKHFAEILIANKSDIKNKDIAI